MITENTNFSNTKEQANATLQTNNIEVSQGGIIGIFTDTIYHSDGRVEVREEQHNCIVKNIGKLIACLLKGEKGYSGLKYWAIGSGSDSWNVSNPPEAQPSDTGCVNEIGRKEILADSIIFVDESNHPSGGVTNSIRVTVVFGEEECNGVWREFSLFGGNATSSPNSGLAINHKTHGVMVKTNTMTVERQIRFIFN